MTPLEALDKFFPKNIWHHCCSCGNCPLCLYNIIKNALEDTTYKPQERIIFEQMEDGTYKKL